MRFLKISIVGLFLILVGTLPVLAHEPEGTVVWEGVIEYKEDIIGLDLYKLTATQGVLSGLPIDDGSYVLEVLATKNIKWWYWSSRDSSRPQLRIAPKKKKQIAALVIRWRKVRPCCCSYHCY